MSAQAGRSGLSLSHSSLPSFITCKVAALASPVEPWAAAEASGLGGAAPAGGGWAMPPDASSIFFFSRLTLDSTAKPGYLLNDGLLPGNTLSPTARTPHGPSLRLCVRVCPS